MFLLPAPHLGQLLPAARQAQHRAPTGGGKAGKAARSPWPQTQAFGDHSHLTSSLTAPSCSAASLTFTQTLGLDPATVRGSGHKQMSVPGHIKSLGFNHLCFCGPRPCTRQVLKGSLLDNLPGQSEGPLQQVII